MAIILCEAHHVGSESLVSGVIPCWSTKRCNLGGFSGD
nr:MAG TPA: hypothetical protein [Caudoviricetes sp.]